MAKNVVSPAIISVRTLEPRSEMWKNLSIFPFLSFVYSY
jgi:hypothetical protein